MACRLARLDLALQHCGQLSGNRGIVLQFNIPRVAQGVGQVHRGLPAGLAVALQGLDIFFGIVATNLPPPEKQPIQQGDHAHDHRRHNEQLQHKRPAGRLNRRQLVVGRGFFSGESAGNDI